ncbi:cold-shock protein [Candidatus Thiothrix anitrata]|uniref:Cold shock domain-containing protein n=1 Tax=Candidatus Thiothrix anitrata TaxID=2823902 RepID=A0ABX7X8Q2_9GAMM|nr:cold shock domain-containing protein [Candidatus Thiothrix anitrata]QTR51611.1 cold shock domain-containing protein [Candidatus Thiothrix anitrata]
MNGVIKTFLPEKRYGFIKGDDGKDYFFHQNEFKSLPSHNSLCEGLLVEFDQQVTPKGYKARKCHLLDVKLYSLPDEFIASKKSSVSGWEMVDGGQWVVTGTSRVSPDAAMRDAKGKAFQQLGANALLNLNYHKSRGSEAGTGSGTYHFTIHHYRGIAVTLAKKDINGEHQLNDLKGVNQRASSVKQELLRKAQRTTWLGAIGLTVLFVVSAAADPVIGIIVTIIAGIKLREWIAQGDWLQRVGS